MAAIEYIVPNWPLSSKVKAYTTMRFGGKSEGEYFSLNLAGHVGDDFKLVTANRKLLEQALNLPKPPLWINQVHSARVIQVPVDQTLIDDYIVNQQIMHTNSSLHDSNSLLSRIFDVDAVYTHEPNNVCAVLTADCVPILLCNSLETEVCAVHAGWSGIIAGVVQNAVYTMNALNNDDKDDFLYAWIGPCIGKESFEVGEEVLLKFATIDKDFTTCFVPSPKAPNKWLGDLPSIVSIILQKAGIKPKNIYYADIDSHQDGRFFSYRRNKVTGRFVSLIWLDQPEKTKS